MLTHCRLCPRCCGVDRTAGRLGACRIGSAAKVASAMPHFGEEPVLVGRGGSGTIFFAGCNLDCVFCQNHDISHSNGGEECTVGRLAAMMTSLAETGCENINFVTPTHVSHAVAEAIVAARSGGFVLPVVYNCGGYESVETLRLLEGLIDIYMPDFKYADAHAGLLYSGVPDYPSVATAALKEMYRQIGPLELNDAAVAVRGVLVRHLVMPNDIAASGRVIDIIAEAAPGCAINVMAQYRPAYRAYEFAELVGRISAREVEDLRRRAVERGLVRVDH